MPEANFYEWIVTQTNFDNLVGDIARDVARDPNVISSMSYEEIREHVILNTTDYFQIQKLEDWDKDGKVHPKVCLELAYREYKIFLEKRKLKKYVSESFDGFIYFLRDPKIEDEVKIGRARDVKRRVASFNTGRARDLEIIHEVYSGDYKSLEKKIHKYFEKDKIRREWFKIAKDRLQDFLDSMYDYI